MKILVPLVLVLLSLAFWLAVDQKTNDGRLPDDEEVSHTQERNKVTGELYNVQIVRCHICGQVLSYIQCNLMGRVLRGYVYSHRCGRFHNNREARYNGSGIGPLDFDFLDWLDKWQRRLRLRR